MTKFLKILTTKDKQEEELLRETSEPVTSDDFNNPEFLQFTKDLLKTAKESKIPACGIAAPQVGLFKRLFYILNNDTNQWELIINPKIEPVGFAKTGIQEACLSVPEIQGKVLRYKNIKVKYQDISGKWQTKKYNDYNAITVQHENDHLNGILFIDKMEK